MKSYLKPIRAGYLKLWFLRKLLQQAPFQTSRLKKNGSGKCIPTAEIIPPPDSVGVKSDVYRKNLTLQPWYGFFYWMRA